MWIASSRADDDEQASYPESNKLNVRDPFHGCVLANGCRIFSGFGSGIAAGSDQLTNMIAMCSQMGAEPMPATGSGWEIE